jgi:hypothetical protein
VLLINGRVIASGFDFNVGNDPIEVIYFTTSEWSSNATVTVELAIMKSAGPAATFLKLAVQFGAVSSFEYATNSSNSVDFIAAMGAGVGAAYWKNTPAFGVLPPILESTPQSADPPFCLIRQKSPFKSRNSETTTLYWT